MPGAFELPLIAKYAALSGRYGAVVCLGAVIRGETDHYEYVAGEAARGIQQVQLETGIPCGFGVLTVDSIEQASERVQGGSKRDTGRHAVEAVLASLAAKEALAERRGPAGSPSSGPRLSNRGGPVPPLGTKPPRFVRLYSPSHGQGLSRMREGPVFWQQPEPLDGGHATAL